MPDPTFADRAEPVLGNTGALLRAAQYLARQPGLAAWFRRWAQLEAAAITLYTYECRMIPGLLQTKAYVQALAADQLPPLDDSQIEDRWAARAERQQLLRERPNTAFSFILEEHLFLRRTGGAEVTSELIYHVLELTKLRNVEIQIMPLVQESHAGLQGPMRLLETPENKWFAYCEGQESGQLISDRKLVSVLQSPVCQDAFTGSHPEGLHEPAAADARRPMSTSELTWFKSSYSSASGDDCVEVALAWRKSSYCSSGSGDCVEVATCPHTIHVRDSKNRRGPALTLSPATWTEFIAHVRPAGPGPVA